MSRPGYDEAVASWSAHLRSGGTTTWSAWRSTVPAALPEGTTPHHPTPDAVHLELVRRLNLQSATPHPALADLVLATGTPGRGRVDVPLPWPAEPHGFGSPPIEPDQLPAEELNRLAVGVLARLLPGVPPRPPEPGPDRWPLPWRRRFRLYGAPETVAVVRRMLLDQGLVESDWRPVHVVLGRPLDVMLAEHWAARTRRGGAMALGTVWRRRLAADRLPRGLDLPALARDLAGRPHEPVHVVVGRDPEHVAALVAGVLGVREAALAPTTDPTLTDLTRRLNRLLTLTEGPARVRELAATLAATVLDPAAPPRSTHPAPPPRARDWAEQTARRMAHRLQGGPAEAGYAVHGTLGDLSPVLPADGRTDRPTPRGPDPDETLGLALTACLKAWTLQGGP